MANLQGRNNVRPVGESNQVMLILQGSQVALYLNGQPATYFLDNPYVPTDEPPSYQVGCIRLVFEGDSPGKFDPQTAAPVNGEFDNVKFWDITNLP